MQHSEQSKHAHGHEAVHHEAEHHAHGHVPHNKAQGHSNVPAAAQPKPEEAHKEKHHHTHPERK